MTFHEFSNGFSDEHQHGALVLNKINVLVGIIDICDLKILWANRHFLNRMGLSPSVLLNMTSDELFLHIHPDYREILAESLSQINGSNGTCHACLCRIMTKGRCWTWVLASYNIFERNGNGKASKVLLYATEVDISKLYDQLRIITNQDKNTTHYGLIKTLSPREKKVIELISNGESDREISEKLEISIYTAKTHRKRIIHKLGLKNSSTLVKFAIENGLD
jgi:DNA-binding CsgD family transcriptional regulator